jgi:hypothetical protein
LAEADVMYPAYTRIYTDADGETHFEDVDLEWTAEQRPGVHSAQPIGVRDARFRWTGGEEYFGDWHGPGQPQFAITLTGCVEIEVSDGEVRQFGPGKVMLFEDVTGKGHITRGVGNEKRLTVFIPLVRD